VDPGGRANNQDGQGGRKAPDEEQMRLGRSRVARGFDPADEGRPLDGFGASSGLIGASGPEMLPVTPGDPSSTPGGTGPGGVGAPRFRPWSEPSPSGSGPMRCHFLRSVGPDGRLAEAQKMAVPTHRCAAFGDPLPLSLRQQELVCLQRVHASCPRYVRGTLLANENQVQAVPEERPTGGVSTKSIVGIVLVILALVILMVALLGFTPFGGGSASQSPVAAGSVSASPTGQVSLAPATPTMTPTPAASPTLTPTPTVTASWPPGATAERMALLVPCTGQPDCYVYTVRGPGPPPEGNGSKVGDTLQGIADWFGVSLAAIREMNPWLGGGSLIHPGDKLKIPPPTK
jgi:hypothetical protein